MPQDTEKPKQIVDLVKKMAGSKHDTPIIDKPELASMTKKYNSQKRTGGHVLPGTQDLGSMAGFVARSKGELGQLADSKSQTKYLANQTAKMKAAMAKRKVESTNAPKERKSMGALLGIAGVINASSKRR
jgi:hypothetical protein